MNHAALAVFYHHNGSGYVDAVGDRSVLILDGRERRVTHHADAADWGRKHGFDGYRLARGRISDPFFLTAAVQPCHQITHGGN